MKVLFICRGNVGRSQWAEAILKKMRPDIEVVSAGTRVVGKDGTTSKHGQLLKDLPAAEYVISPLKKDGIDISEKSRTQLTNEMLDGTDRIIIMAEKETISDYLSANKKAIYWDVPDPKGHDLAFHHEIKDRIEKLILENIGLFK